MKPDGDEKADPARPAASIAPSVAMRAVLDGWETFLRPGAFDEDASFEESGGDSLKGLSLLLFLESRLSLQLAAQTLTMATRPSTLIASLTGSAEAPTTRGQTEAGQLDGRPLLLLFAGLYGADVQTTEFGRRLEPWFQTILVDFRWGGDDFAGTFSAEAYFGQIGAMVRRHGPRRLWLFGHSYGGKLAAEAARRLIEAGYPVEFVGVFDGLAKDDFLKRHSAALKGMILGDRLKQGVQGYGGAFNYATSGVAQRLAAGLAARRRYGLLDRLMKVLSVPSLTAANLKARRSVMAAVRLKAFEHMPLGPVATRLWLYLSNEDRFDPSLYPTLGWDAYFACVEIERLDARHLDIFKGESAEALIERLADIESRLRQAA